MDRQSLRLELPPEHHTEYPSEELQLVWAREPGCLPEHHSELELQDQFLGHH